MRKLGMQELNRPSLDEVKNIKKNPFVLVLDNVRSLNNVGSAFRTADAFLCEKIFLCGITGTPPHREIDRAALGAVESVTWAYHPSTIKAVRQLKAAGYTICGVEQVDQKTWLQDYNFEPDRKYAFIFGHELNGLSDEVLDELDVCLEIPQFGAKHSLNISVSVGIVLWEAIRMFKR